MFKRGLLINTAVIDADYRWRMQKHHTAGYVPIYDQDTGLPIPLTIKGLITNIGWVPRHIKVGDRIGQIVVPWTQACYVSLIPAVASSYPSHIIHAADGWHAQREDGIGSTGR
jgi:dUTPase